MHDLTHGTPSRVLWRFCLPLFGSVIFQQLYNIADSLVAGQCIGEDALAAVGNSYEVTLIFLAFAFGCNIGTSVIVSQLFGARRLSDMKTAVYTSMFSCAVLCALLMVAGFFLSEPLLRLIHTPENIFRDSALYLDIYILGLPFVFFYNVATGIFSALGDSRTPFLFLAASSTANIAADFLFVTAFGMGVDGVAWATFLCQGVSCLLAVVVVFRRLTRIPTEQKAAFFSFSLLLRTARISVPSIFQQSFISVGNIVIQGIINPFGSAAIAGYAAAVKLHNLTVTSFTTIGNGISNYTAQNLGAGNDARVRTGLRAGIRMTCLLALPLALCYFFAGEWLIRLFLNDPSDAALEAGILFLRIVAPFYFAVACKLTIDGVLRGAGQMLKFMTDTLSDLLLRILFAYLLSAALGLIGVWLAWPIGWIIGVLLAFLFYRCTRWDHVASKVSGRSGTAQETPAP